MKKALIVAIGVPIIVICVIWMIFRDNPLPNPDTVFINDAVVTATQSDTQSEALEILTRSLQQEYQRMEAARLNRDIRMIILLCVLVVFMTAATVFIMLHIRRNILLPFQKLQRFARSIAAGELDIPLKMDRGGSFGAFTESFDIMREELKTARENERAAERSKKELVASLSHDIKTPVASIKATVELMLVSADNEKEQAQLKQIEMKAEQINTLITDMFHATLHELEKLSVAPTEVQSTTLPDIISNADYKNRVKPFEIPECIIVADLVRLQQVFDNIIGNSYKYADTDISISASIDGGFLDVEITDNGNGVPEEELTLLTSKFYRGKNAAEKSGYGLGLYISSYLITQMHGELECKSDGSFTVTLRLKLA